MRQPIEGTGTAESVWLPWLAAQDWPVLDVEALGGRRVVVVAAHPDDDVLGIGGLLRRLAPISTGVEIVWASDGEASHPGARHPVAAQLAALRPLEAERAVAALGFRPRTVQRLQLPDSDLAQFEERIAEAVSGLVTDGCLVLAPWAGDGHPDHEACGRAARAVCADGRADLFEYPVWAWHWATPQTPQPPGPPWGTAARVELDAGDLAAKLAAIGAFATQVLPLGPSEAQAPVLPAHVVMRFVRSTEVVFATDVAGDEQSP